MTHAIAVPHFVLLLAQALAATLCVTATGYSAFAIYCARDFFSTSRSPSFSFAPPISILKPVCGLDRESYANFASFCRQTYPTIQILFGAERSDDPGLTVARRIARDFPHLDILVVATPNARASNPKVGILAALARHARHPYLLVSDSDIRVGPMHLATLAQPMADPRVGVVTCLYRSIASGVAGALDALGLSTDFQPSVLVARKIEGITFGLGSGTLLRRLALEAAGGFEAIADSLADDYMLGHLPVRAGYRAVLSPDIVDHELSTSSLRGIAEHQLRWNRGIRSVRPAGYLGLAFTQGVPASLFLLLLTAGSPASWTVLGMTLGARLAMAWFVAVRCLHDRAAARSLWLLPLRDLMNFAFWIAAFFGNAVVWRGTRYRLQPGGRLAREGAVGEEESEPALVGTQAAP